MSLLDSAPLMGEIARRLLLQEREHHALAVAALDPAERSLVLAEANRHRDHIDDIVAGFGARLARRHPTLRT